MEKGQRRSHYIVEELRSARDLITAHRDENLPVSPNNPVAKFNAYVNPENPGHDKLPALRIIGNDIEQRILDGEAWTKVEGTVVLGKAHGIKREMEGEKEASYLYLRDDENEYRLPAVAIVAVGAEH